MAESKKQGLPHGDVLVETCDDLILITSRMRDRVEVIDCAIGCNDAIAVGVWPKVEQRFGGGVDSIRWDNVAYERLRNGSALRTSTLCIEHARTGIENRGLYHGKIAGALFWARDRCCVRLPDAQAKALPA